MKRMGGMMVVMLAVSPAPAAHPPHLAIRTIDRSRLAGELLALSAKDGMAIRTDAGEKVVVPLAELIEARTEGSLEGDDAGVVEPSSAGWPRVFATHDGQRLVGRLIAAAGQGRPAAPQDENLPRARGHTAGSVQIHSVRLPGLVAHQEVIFGGLGQTLSIRHDSISRESFMPGVLLAIRKVRGLSGLTVGLEKVL